MNKIDLKKTTYRLLDSFLKAGKLAKEIAHRGVKVTIKSDNTPVTDGDLAVDQLLREKIENLTPDIPIISEETVNTSEENKYKNFWLIDPIDGTKDYIKKKDEYTINAALIINLEPSLGIIYAPEKGRLFYSYGSGNAFELCNNKTISLNCLKKTEKGKVFALHNSSTLTPDIVNAHEENNVFSCTKMSSSLKFCIIAAGEADLYIAGARAYEWDIAAGHAIVEHAGGYFTTTGRKKLLYGKKDYKNPGIIVRRADNLLV